LQGAFPVDVPMVPLFALAFCANGEHLMHGGFSLSETVRLWSFEFIVDYFGVLSLSPRRRDSGIAFMGSTRSGPPSPWWAVDKGLHRGVPHGFKWRRGLQPPLSQEA
jgi:hypothetical protein